MFNHYKSQRQIHEALAEIKLFSAVTEALNGRWRPGAHISENVKTSCKIGAVIKYESHISGLNNYILA